MHATALDGLFDLQINGFGGVDFQSTPPLESVQHACSRLHECGMRRILATFITDDSAATQSKLKAFESYRALDPLIRETIVGYHLEGPYLSSELGYRGAHPAECMRDPDWTEFEHQQDAAGGAIRLVTLAPERKGSADFISKATSTGVRVALGHTNASDSEIDIAIQAGATLCTHLGNGCPELMPRHNNIIQRLLARDELIACLIPDGIHLPSGMLRNLFRAKPPGKVILTTDAMAAAGAGPGRYRLGRVEVEVGADEIVRMPDAPNFAGSALRLDHGVERAAQWLGIPISEAQKLAGEIPAQALGY
ncbi:MAG: N-acetylglucosamine-6-phosphate deacetylase [Verrucomicrobiota bacterium]